MANGSGHSGDRPLLERDGVIAAARACLQGARHGTGGALFIVGESGLGKTTVLRAIEDLAREEMDIGSGRGEVMERVVPFGLLEQALSSLHHDAGLALSGERSVSELSVPYFRLLRWIERRHERPFLLALDDLHWADEDSLRMVAFLARRARWLPLAVIGTLRPWPTAAEELCDGLAQSGDALLWRLEPLGLEAAAQLLADNCGGPVPDETAERAWSMCGGNPLLVEQLAVGLARGEQLPNLRRVSGWFGEHLLLTRFAGLDQVAWRAARAASVLGTRFRFDVAVEVAELDEAEGDHALEALDRSRLVITEDGYWVTFTHALFGQALYDDIASPARRRLHIRAFEVLLRHGAETQAAEHAIRAGLVGDERAIAVLERTGRAALASCAVATASQHLAAAVQFSGERAGAELVLAFVQALTANGCIDEAAAECARLLTRRDLSWQQRIEALSLCGRVEYLSGKLGLGERALEEAATLAIEHDPVAAVQPLLDQSLSAWLHGGPKQALPLALRARELATDRDEALRERAETTWGHLALQVGDAGGLVATDRLLAVLDQPEQAHLFDPAELIWPWASVYLFALSSSYVERYDDAMRALRLARAAAEEAGSATGIATVSIHLGGVLIRAGRLEEALREVTAAVELVDLTPGVLAQADLVQAEALLWLGRIPESEEQLARALGRSSEPWFMVALWASHIRGLRLLWAGDAAASDELLEAERLTREAGIGEPCLLQWAGHAIDAHLSAGHLGRAQGVLEWLEQHADQLPCRWPRIQVALGRARVAWHVGEAEVAEASFAEAVTLHSEAELPLSRIETLLAYGRFLRLNAHPAEARGPISEALAGAEAVGAAWLARAAGEELRLAGGKRRRSKHDRDELTEAEQRVAHLAADGHSNAEIARLLYLSVNTVQTHLKHVYRKLGITSRRQLMMRRRDSVAGR